MSYLPCLKCREPRRPGQYLCRADWYRLPSHTRQLLNRRDSKALARLRELHDQLTSGIPLAEIEVTP
ncbi:hypothetical protein [Streptomyces umbrinus]|uniref:hypothetical protein n=1 Tax=Streptomyces umbrinus TaxID=67370 RepID=UPI003C2ECDD6